MTETIITELCGVDDVSVESGDSKADSTHYDYVFDRPTYYDCQKDLGWFNLIRSKDPWKESRCAYRKILEYNELDLTNEEKNGFLSGMVTSTGLSCLDRVPMSDSYALTKLEVSGRSLNNIDILRDYKYLQYVDISNNDIVDLSPLNGAQFLTLLDASHNRLVDFSLDPPPLFLSFLNLSFNGIEATPDLTKYWSLKHLNLSDNKIKVIEGINNLSCVRPRYKRLVDNIFPQVPQDGLVKNNMDKLVFYSLSSPEKLDRIGDYLYLRASRDIARKRIGFVVIAMEAMDQLLAACHAQALNLFVESFLKMIQRLLESSEGDLQILATQSFVKFANIEEDTPSYHRRYEFFVSKFSSMCHNNHDKADVRNSIRLSGIKGLQGVIRKTMSDDLVENIWEPTHMEKIIPSLLFNMQDSRYYKRDAEVTDSGCVKEEPGFLADQCLRELTGRASFGHVRSVLKPVLEHLDRHHLWVPNEFAIHAFRVVMFSIQNQYSYAVVENLMYHLGAHSNSAARIRTSIVHVLTNIIAIAAGESVGPSVLEIINLLLSHIKSSASRRQDEGERQYLDALIACLGEFTAHLPDYQKVEIMVFIVSKVPGEPYSVDRLLREMLLKSLLIVGQNYTSVLMSTSFPSSLLGPLLQLCTNPDSSLLALQVLHTLLDRHQNLTKLNGSLRDVSDISRDACSRADTVFLRKNEEEIYSCVIQVLSSEDLTLDIAKAAFTTMALIAVELLSEQTVASYITTLCRIQDIATKPPNLLTTTQKCHLLVLTLDLLKLVNTVVSLHLLDDYVQEVIARRSTNTPKLIVELQDSYDIDTLDLAPDELLDDKRLSDALKQSGIEITDMTRVLTHRHSWVESASAHVRGSLSDSTASSASSTPRIQKKLPGDELTFEAVKKVLTDESGASLKEQEKQKQKTLFDIFRNANFEDIVNNNTVKDEDTLQRKLSEILDKTPSAPFHHSTSDKPPLYLEYLNLSRNKLVEIGNIQSIPLKELNLSWNEITRCASPSETDPNQLSHTLVKLDLSHNKIRNFRDLGCLCDCCLRHLNLSNNELDSVSSFDDLKRFKKIKRLNLQVNPIMEVIPEVRKLIISYLPRLKYLNGQKITKRDRSIAYSTYSSHPLVDQMKKFLHELIYNHVEPPPFGEETIQINCHRGVVAVVGPPGSNRASIVQEAAKRFPEFVRIPKILTTMNKTISHSPLSQVLTDEEFEHVEREEFHKLWIEGKLLLVDCFIGNMFGIRYDEFNEDDNRVLLMAVTVEGALSLKWHGFDPTLIAINFDDNPVVYDPEDGDNIKTIMAGYVASVMKVNREMELQKEIDRVLQREESQWKSCSQSEFSVNVDPNCADDVSEVSKELVSNAESEDFETKSTRTKPPPSTPSSQQSKEHSITVTSKAESPLDEVALAAKFQSMWCEELAEEERQKEEELRARRSADFHKKLMEFNAICGPSAEELQHIQRIVDDYWTRHETLTKDENLIFKISVKNDVKKAVKAMIPILRDKCKQMSEHIQDASYEQEPLYDELIKPQLDQMLRMLRGEIVDKLQTDSDYASACPSDLTLTAPLVSKSTSIDSLSTVESIIPFGRGEQTLYEPLDSEWEPKRLVTPPESVASSELVAAAQEASRNLCDPMSTVA